MISDRCIRLASQHDLDTLVALEEVGFHSDRFTEEQIEYLLTRARSSIFVIEMSGRIAGVAYMLWHKSYAIGRLYNLVVHPDFQGHGLGALLMDECEIEAARRGRTQVSLEVRCDNANAIRFYEKRGYVITDTMKDYYSDGSPGHKMIRSITPQPNETFRVRVPYHAQSLDFTCGPASLMMAMKYLDPSVHTSHAMEIRLWKEATLVFLAAGVGGTGPYGLALAAARRGFDVRVINSSEKPPFLKSVRTPKKRDIIKLVHEDMRKEALDLGVAGLTYDFALEDITAALLRGYLPIALISTYRLTGDRVPHWVVVTGFDADHVFIHDPDEESYHTDRAKVRHMKLARSEFNRMSRYGKDVFRSVVLIGKKQSAATPVRTPVSAQ